MQEYPLTQNELDTLAYEMAPLGIVLTEQRIVRSCNTTFANMVGYDKQDIIGQSFRMFYGSRQEFDDIRDVGLEPLKAKGLYTDERMVKCKNDTQIWCRFRAQALNKDEPLDQMILSFTLISDATDTASFTLRERQVIGHLSAGKTSKEIGNVLKISPRTVEDVRARLLKKLNVRNAAELLARLNHMPQ